MQFSIKTERSLITPTMSQQSNLDIKPSFHHPILIFHQIPLMHDKTCVGRLAK